MKTILPVLIVIFVIIGYIFYRSPVAEKLLPNPTPTPVVNKFNLPQGWTEVSSPSVFLKLQKKLESGYQPQIAVVKSVLPEDTSESKYINNLIAGTRSAIPSYRVISNQDSKIEAYYFQNKQKINLTQRIYVMDNNIYVLTGSFVEDQKLTDEINQIFDLIYSEKLN